MSKPTFVTMNTITGQVMYCLCCAEYRSTVIVQRRIVDSEKDEYTSTAKCTDCGSKNVRKIQSTSTGLRARTEVAKDV